MTINHPRNEKFICKLIRLKIKYETGRSMFNITSSELIEQLAATNTFKYYFSYFAWSVIYEIPL